jgi:hypothetical protein
MSQFLRPSADVSAGLWTTAPLFSKLNEVVPADASFIESASNPANDACEIALDAGRVPLFTPAPVLRYRYAKDVAAGRTIELAVQLRENSTILESFIHGNISEVATQATQTIRSLPNDWSQVRVRFSANASGAGGARKARVSWCELESGNAVCPFIRTADLSHIVMMMRTPVLGESKREVIRAMVAYAAAGAPERAAMERLGKAMYEALEGLPYISHAFKHWIEGITGESNWEV